MVNSEKTALNHNTPTDLPPTYSQISPTAPVIVSVHPPDETPYYNPDLTHHDEELPPPYQELPSRIPVVNCRICRTVINLMGKMHQHVVKCTQCDEATPIKAAPAGKKYVRCSCNCLLICKTVSQRIACPRANCKRIINLGTMNSAGAAANSDPSRTRALCVHCKEIFFVKTIKSLVRCPHCRAVSSVGKNFARTRAMIYFAISFVTLLIGVGVTVGTYELAVNGGVYVTYIGAFLISISCLIRGLYYLCMGISEVQGPA